MQVLLFPYVPMQVLVPFILFQSKSMMIFFVNASFGFFSLLGQVGFLLGSFVFDYFAFLIDPILNPY